MQSNHSKNSFWNKISNLVSNKNISLSEICNKDNYRQSVTALMIIIAVSDDEYREEEHNTIKTLLVDEFNLTNDVVEELIIEARNKTEQSIDLYNFVRIINQNLDQEGRLEIVRMLWKVVFADRKIKNQEDNMIKKLCHLLGISNSDRISLKNEVYKDVLKTTVE